MHLERDEIITAHRVSDPDVLSRRIHDRLGLGRADQGYNA
jgi:hypothetical protein